MKGLILGLLLGLQCSAFAEEAPGVDVVDIRDPMRICDCNNPAHLGRICIVTSKWAHDDVRTTDVYDNYLTRFEPSIEATTKTFVFKSVAYYTKCDRGETPFTYVDDWLQAWHHGRIDFITPYLKEYTPLMRVALVDSAGVVGAYTKDFSGTTQSEEIIVNKYKKEEASIMGYPGTVIYETELAQLLTEAQIRSIVESNKEVTRYMKAILSAQVSSGNKQFGQYTVKLRFYKKPNVTPKNAMDVSAIAIQALN